MNTTPPSVTLTRILDAPRYLVWAAWTQPAHLGWYLNPGQETDAPIEVDLRVGGTWRVEMVETPEKRYFTGGIYRRIEPEQVLEFTFGAVGGWPELSGDAVDAAPIVTITLDELAGSTEMTLDMRFPAHIDAERVQQWLDLGMEDGWRQTIDRLVPAN